MKITVLSAALLSCCITLTTTSLTISGAQAQTNSAKRQCIRAANTTGVACTRECSAQLEDSLLICSASGNTALADCYTGCQADKESCLKPFQDNLKVCSDACFTSFDAALVACEAGDCKVDARSCTICKLTAKLARLECADGCLDAFQTTKAARASCRVTFRSCIKTCKLANK